jgi:uncharacterized protein (DUF1800 family)
MAGDGDAYLGMARFGLGPRGDQVVANVRDALVGELADPAAALLEGPGLLDSAAAFEAYQQQRQRRREAKADAASVDDGMEMSDDAAMVSDGSDPKRPGRKRRTQREEAALNVELPVRLKRIATAEIGYLERLVMFWTNHFAIEAQRGGQLRALAGPFEREAIRPHVLGRFEDLLFAATRHPAMLYYLNNATSIGPDSPMGERNGKGLNENHARELMELHTLGVDGGYSQADVTSLALILTGWSVGRAKGNDEAPGQFVFRRQAHEPGAQTLLGESYAQKGVSQGEAALRTLATAPATAAHIATKLARHFVADDPPGDLVAQLTSRFLDTGGDLRAVSETLVTADASWSAPPTKLRSPQEFVYAAIRALNVKPKPREVTVALASLGQPLMSPGSPAGFADDLATWLAPDAMTNRLDIAELLAQRADAIDPRELAMALFGERLDMATGQAIARAESPTQGLALLLMSPQFQRR